MQRLQFAPDPSAAATPISAAGAQVLLQVSFDAAPCYETLGTYHRTFDCTDRNGRHVRRTLECRNQNTLQSHP